MVLDLGLAVAGPFGTQMLADFGADVIKVNQPSDQTWMNTYMGMSCNRGKRSIVPQPQDRTGHGGLPRPGGRGRCRPHQHALRRRGASRGRLRVPASDQSPAHLLPYPRASRTAPACFSPAMTSPAVHSPAWPGRKAEWGRAASRSGPTSRSAIWATACSPPPRYSTPCSTGTAPGRGSCVTTSIVYAHLLNNSTRWVDAEGRSGPGQPHLDALALGLSALERLYPCAEGWICLAAEEHWAELARPTGPFGPDLRSPLRHRRRTHAPTIRSWRRFSSHSSPPAPRRSGRSY